MMKLLVPAEWMQACGHANKDTVFDVIRIKDFGPGRTFAVVRDNGRQWEVWVEARGARLFEETDDTWRDIRDDLI